MQGRRKAAFFYAKKLYFCVYCRHSHSPITASAKQAARTQAAKRKRLHNAGESESESACTPLRAGRKAARQSVEQIRLTVSGLVTANMQAHGSWVRARTDYAGRSASCVKMVDCMNLFRISHASVRA